MGLGFVVGVFRVTILAYAAYSTNHSVCLLKILDEKFSNLPVNLIRGLVLCMWATLTVPGKFLLIHPDSEDNRKCPEKIMVHDAYWCAGCGHLYLLYLDLSVPQNDKYRRKDGFSTRELRVHDFQPLWESFFFGGRYEAETLRRFHYSRKALLFGYEAETLKRFHYSRKLLSLDICRNLKRGGEG